MPDVLARARADRDALAARAASLLAEVEKLDAFILLYSKYAGDDRPTSATNVERKDTAVERKDTAVERKDTAVERRALKEGSTPYRMAKAAADRVALAEMLGDVPPTIKDLLDAVRVAGFVVNGERPATGLSSVLSRSDLLTYQRGTGWCVTHAYRALSADEPRNSHSDVNDAAPSKDADDSI